MSNSYAAGSTAARENVAVWVGEKLKTSEAVKLKRKHLRHFRDPVYQDSMLVSLRKRVATIIVNGVDVERKYKRNKLVGVTVRRHPA